MTPEHFLSGGLEVDPSFREKVDMELEQQVGYQRPHDNHRYDTDHRDLDLKHRPGEDYYYQAHHRDNHPLHDDHYICDENHYHRDHRLHDNDLHDRFKVPAQVANLPHQEDQYFSDGYLVRNHRSRSRSRDRGTPSILKRGRSLERARSRERSREREGRHGRSRSPSHSPSHGRSHSRSRSRSRNRSPGECLNSIDREQNL